jgi:hypothetical protein
MLDEFMKTTLSNMKDQSELLHRLAKVRRDSPPRFGTMTAHQMICHLSDSFRSSLGEKFVSPSTNLFKRTIYKWIALWAPLPWPVGVRTRPEIDQRLNGTAIGLMEQVENDKTDHNVLAMIRGEHRIVDDLMRAILTDFVNHVFNHIPDSRTVVGNFLEREAAIAYISSHLDPPTQIKHG